MAPIAKKEWKTVYIDLDHKTEEFLIKEESNEELNKELLKEILSLEEIKFLRNSIKNNSLLLKKIIEISESSRNFFEANTDYEQLFEDAKNLSIEKLGFFAIFFRKQLLNKDSFKLILSNSNKSFEHWFKTYVKYRLLISLEAFFESVVTSLSEIRNILILEKDIEITKKSLIRFIEENLIQDFKNFLFEDWNYALEENKSYEEKRKKISNTIII
ncbi:MAG: hypothetical protein ACRCRZ_02680 [Metamycoplasmataceae bacterium]